MSSRDEQWWDLQAAEYVLGTLSEQDRAVFERLLESDLDAQRAVAQWEQRLDPLHQSTPSVTPPEGAYRRIVNRIEWERETNTSSSGASKITEFKEQVRFWKTAMFTSLAAVGAIVAINFVQISNQNVDGPAPTTVVAELTTVTVLEDESGQPIWAVNYRSSNSDRVLNTPTDASDLPSASLDNTGAKERNVNAGELVVSVVGELPLDDDKSHQLWMVLADGSGVASVGLMPNAPGENRIISLPLDLSKAASFAVSLETFGGVPGPEHGPIVAINPIVTPIDSI